MRGTVISFDQMSNTGIISGYDGNRYTFYRQDWRANSFPQPGLETDFVAENYFAREVMVIQSNPVQYSATVKTGKERIAYILLGIFLGVFGAHNFYAGYNGKAIAQLLITILSFGILSFVPFIWAIIEVITVTVDSTGRPMT